MLIRTTQTQSFARFSAACTCRALLLQALLLTCCAAANAQAVSEVITDYGGYWKSGSGSINPTKPDNSHNLLAFTYNGNRYSTGVNDDLLAANGERFITGDYKALPVLGLSGALTSNTKLALGALYDGVAGGASNPAPANNIPHYLTDGTRGLDMGTGAANLPKGALTFGVNDMQAQAIGDGVPDILVTQMADPSSAVDSYRFTDASGNTIGNFVDIHVANLPVLGNWTGDFYEASQNPAVLTPGFTQSDRPLRIFAADFSAFGISSSNIGQIASFKIELSGNSDVAFVANNSAVVQILAVKLNYFKSSNQQLSWQTAQETGSSHFVVERSFDGAHFTALDSVPATGHSTAPRSYQYAWPTAPSPAYYRLRAVSADGSFSYSAVLHVGAQAAAPQLQVFPNPASAQAFVRCPEAAGAIRVFNAQGALVKTETTFNSNLISLSLHGMASGIYTVQFSGARGSRYTSRLLVK